MPASRGAVRHLARWYSRIAVAMVHVSIVNNTEAVRFVAPVFSQWATVAGCPRFYWLF